MDTITAKDLKNILKEELEPIKKTLDEHTEKLKGHDNQLKSIGTILEEHSQKLDSLTLDMIDVQRKTDLLPDIHDMLKGTKTQVDDHEERITTLEAA